MRRQSVTPTQIGAEEVEKVVIMFAEYEFPKRTCGDGHKGTYYDKHEVDADYARLRAEVAEATLRRQETLARYDQLQAEVEELKEQLQDQINTSINIQVQRDEMETKREKEYEQTCMALIEATQQLQQARARVMELEQDRDQWKTSAEFGNGIISMQKERFSPLTWNTQNPTTPGWYWWRALNGGVAIVQIAKQCDGTLFVLMGTYSNKLEGFDGHWCGPLSPPQERET